MKLLAGVIGVALLGTATQVSAETIKFAIVRNGEQIGTHTMEINRAGPETSVKILTDLNVKVLFITAYRLQHKHRQQRHASHRVGIRDLVGRGGPRRWQGRQG